MYVSHIIMCYVSMNTDYHTTYGICHICDDVWSHITKGCAKAHDNAKPFKEYICKKCSKSNDDKREDNEVRLDIECHTRLDNLNEDEDPQLFTTMFDEIQQNTDVRDIIKECFGINMSQRTEFNRSVEAFDWFNRTLGYCNWNKNANLMKFQHPIKPVGLRTDNQYTEFKITYNDFMSLVKKDPLTPGAIDFCLQCLNFYMYHSTSQRNSPKVLFGTTSDHKSLIPSEDDYPAIYEFLEEAPKDETTIAKKNCIEEMKDWVTDHDKEFVTTFLDYFLYHRKFIPEYMTILPVGNSHYVGVRVHLYPNARRPDGHTVMFCDLHQNSEITGLKYGTWFSKYFSLFHYQNRNTLMRNDINCKDIKDSMSTTNTLTEDTHFIPVDEQKVKGDWPLTDNSGIYHLMQCVERITGRTVLETNKMMNDKAFEKSRVTKFRLATASMVKQIYEELHGEQYMEMEEHIKLPALIEENDDGNGKERKIVLYSDNDIDKWEKIHWLFMKGHFTAIPGKHHANHVFEKYTYEQIKKKVFNVD